VSSDLPRPAKQNTTKAWREFLPLLQPFRRLIYWAILAMIVDAALTVFRPWPLKVVIDRVLSDRPSRVPFLHTWLDNAPTSRWHILYGACATTLIIAVSTGILTYYYTRILGDVGQRFVFALRRNLFAHLQRLSLRFHDRQRIGDLISRLTSDIDAIQDMIANGSIVFGSNAFLLTGMLILMFWLNWRFAFAALSVTPLLFWTVFRYANRIRVATGKARASTGLLASLAQETLASIRIVQGLAQEEQQDERFRAQSTTSSQAYLEGIRYQAGIWPVVDLLAAIGLAIVMWYGATRVMAGELSTGDVVIFFAYVTNFYSPMRQLARLSYMFNRSCVGAERIAEVMNVRSEVVDRDGARTAPRLKGLIEFRNVLFEYERARPVLSRIELAIVPGEKVAIVGATGAGKSTLVSLVLRLYDPSEGAVCIDGEDIRNYSVQSLREQIGLVLQDSLLFSGTIRENIAFGRPGASEPEIIAAAVTANADDFIQRLPDGYDTVMAERGSTLSGGEKQRIAIARAVLRDAPILILDEPTSSLDAASEQLVMNALERSAAGRTTLIIAHRLTTVRLADRIVVLEDGRIVEEGNRQELLARQGRYWRLYHLQRSVETDNSQSRRTYFPGTDLATESKSRI
jgi:ATP-binding cassette subfamily B protein